jgi:hypothetical protein
MTDEQASQLDCWAIVEMFGHQRIAGRVKTENFGAACLLRVDVPEVETRSRKTYDYAKGEYVEGPRFRRAAFTRYIGISAIYALNPVTEELAREAAAQLGCEPVNAFGLESVQRLANTKALASGDADDDEDVEEVTAEEAEEG